MQEAGRIDPPIKAVFEGNRGRTPTSATATENPDRFLVTSLNDYNNGLGALTLTRDSEGKLGSAVIKSIDLGQPAQMVGRYRLDIQSAQSAVLVSVDGVEYAIVADANFPFNDPYVRAMYEAPDSAFMTYPGPFGLNGGPPTLFGGSLSAKQVEAGGKLGVVRDPFGKLGRPTFLGATAPQDGIEFKHLSLTDSGNVLLVQEYGAYGVNLLEQTAPRPNAQRAWDVRNLIAAAVARGADLRTPLNVSSTTSIGEGPAPLGRTTGTTTTDGIGTAGQSEWVDAEFTGRMGDVLKIDLKEVIARKALGWPAVDEKMTPFTTAQKGQLNAKIAELNLKNFDVIAGFDWAGFTTNLRSNGFRLVAKSVGSTTYIVSSDADTDGSLGFAKNGVLYLVPNIADTADGGQMPDIERLRRGSTLADRLATLTFTYLQKGESKTLSLDVWAKDYDKGAAVFIGDRPLDNPGYSKLNIAGEISLAAATGGSIDLVNVYRVEQRLKYLGFPAMGSGFPSAATMVGGIYRAVDNIPQTFKVDGK